MTTSFVYFAQAGVGGPVKIGTARNLRSRLFQIQTCNAAEILLLASVPGDEWLEGKIHEHLRADRIRGEWFKPSTELLAMVRELEEVWRKSGSPVEWLWSDSYAPHWRSKSKARAASLAVGATS